MTEPIWSSTWRGWVWWSYPPFRGQSLSEVLPGEEEPDDLLHHLEDRAYLKFYLERIARWSSPPSRGQSLAEFLPGEEEPDSLFHHLEDRAYLKFYLEKKNPMVFSTISVHGAMCFYLERMSLIVFSASLTMEPSWSTSFPFSSTKSNT